MGGKSLARQAEERDLSGDEPEALEAKQIAYRPGYAIRAHDLALRGCNDADIADALDVDPATIVRWKKQLPRFERAIFRGREKALGSVARSLYSAAKGQRVKETKAFVINGAIQTIDVVKELPVSVPAAMAILINRDGGRWKDTKTVEHSGSVSLSALLGSIASAPGDQAKAVEAKVISPADDEADGE